MNAVPAMTNKRFLSFQIIVRLSEFLNWERMAVVYENTVYKQIAAALNQQLKANSVSVPKFIEIGKHTSAIALRKRLQGLLEDILTYSPFIEAVVYFGCKHTATVLFQVVQAEQETNAAYIPRFVLPETNAWDGDIFRYLGFDPLVAKHGPLIITPPYEEITCFSEYWFSLFTNMTQFDMVSTHNAWLNNVFALESEPHCNPKFKACLPFGANDADKKFSYQTLNVKYGIIAAHAMVKALKNIYDMACPADKSNCTLSEFKSVLNRRRGMLLNEMNNLEIHFGSDFNVTAGPLTTSNYTVIFHDKTEPVYSSDNEVYEVYTFGEISSHNLEKSYITKVMSRRSISCIQTPDLKHFTSTAS